MLQINSWEIASWPRAQVDHRFGDVNLCRVDMLNGYTLEILFTSYGYPLLKQSVIAAIQEFYNKRFIPIEIDGEIAFANIMRKKERRMNA